jgi:hypothetical protein
MENMNALEFKWTEKLQEFSSKRKSNAIETEKEMKNPSSQTFKTKKSKLIMKI